MSTEAKIDGKPVEAEVDEKKKETETKEEPKVEIKMKKSGKGKIVKRVLGGLAVAGAAALGIAKILATKNSTPDGHDDSTGSDPVSYGSDTEA